MIADPPRKKKKIKKGQQEIDTMWRKEKREGEKKCIHI